MNRLPGAKDLSAMLAENIDSLVPDLLPAAYRQGGYWRCGNLAGDAGGSLRIPRFGARQGKWTDADTGEYGDALDLVAETRCNGDLREAARFASGWLGILGSYRPPDEADREAARKAAEAKAASEDAEAISLARHLWAGGEPVAGTVANIYLDHRSIGIERPPSLRFCSAWCVEAGMKLPCLLAAISGLDRKVTAVQRIYLRHDGLGKAEVSSPKMTLGRPRTGGCRLAPAGPVLGLAEGIETGMSAMELYGIPVWVACGSRLDQVALPDVVKKLVIFADNGEAGERIAERAILAHEAAGRETFVVFPPPGFDDWNDVAQARKSRTFERFERFERRGYIPAGPGRAVA